MISESKENKLYENRPANSGNGRKLTATDYQVNTNHLLTVAEQTLFPDVEWRRSKSARFQQN